MKRRLVVSSIFLLTVALCAGLVWFNFFRDRMIANFFATMQPPPQTISAVPVTSRTWTPGIMAIGTAQAENGVQLAVETSGVVKDIEIQPSRRFTKGEVLLRLDDTVERAELADAEASLKLNESNIERSESLRAKGFATPAAHDQIVAQLASSRARVERLQAVIGQKALKAPFDGIAGIVRVDYGQFVQAGTVVTTFQDLDSMKVNFTVPEQMAGKVKIGQSVRFGSTEEDLPYSGSVIGIDPRVDPQTRLVSVQAVMKGNKDQRVLPGQFLHVRVELPAEPNVITVPQTAVTTSLYGDYVYIVEPKEKDGKTQQVVSQVFVKVGRRDSGFTEVISGIKDGQTVVVSGQNKLQAGSTVTINNAIDITQLERSDRRQQ